MVGRHYVTADCSTQFSTPVTACQAVQHLQATQRCFSPIIGVVLLEAEQQDADITKGSAGRAGCISVWSFATALLDKQDITTADAVQLPPMLRSNRLAATAYNHPYNSCSAVSVYSRTSHAACCSISQLEEDAKLHWRGSSGSAFLEGTQLCMTSVL